LDLTPIENAFFNRIQVKVEGRRNKLAYHLGDLGLSGYQVLPGVAPKLSHPVNLVKSRERTANGWVNAEKPLRGRP